MFNLRVNKNLTYRDLKSLLVGGGLRLKSIGVVFVGNGIYRQKNIKVGDFVEVVNVRYSIHSEWVGKTCTVLGVNDLTEKLREYILFNDEMCGEIILPGVCLKKI